MTPTDPREINDITAEYIERLRTVAWDQIRELPDNVIRAHVEQARAYVESGGMGWSVVSRALATLQHAYLPETYDAPDDHR